MLSQSEGKLAGVAILPGRKSEVKGCPLEVGGEVKFLATSGSLPQRTLGSPRAVLRQRQGCWLGSGSTGGVGVPPGHGRVQGYTDTGWETIKTLTHERF